MNSLVAAFALGAVAGGTGAAIAERLIRANDVQERLDMAEARMSSLVEETRSILDETRSQLREAWATAAHVSAEEGKPATTPLPVHESSAVAGALLVLEASGA
jgi:hypothetical protein